MHNERAVVGLTIAIIVIIAIILAGVGKVNLSLFKSDFSSSRMKETKSSAVKSSSQTTRSSYRSTKTREQLLAEELERAKREAELIAAKIQKLVEEKEASVYKDKVKIKSGRNLGAISSDKEYISLQASLKNFETISITGWRIWGVSANSNLTIGLGANLPRPYTIGQEPIILNGKDKVIISRSNSPIGLSFRLNKCTGFFEQNKDFFPSLPRQCPSPIEDLPPELSLDNTCVKYVKRLSRCTAPDYEETADAGITGACRAFIEQNINYNACVAKHSSDEDFYKPEWRVYQNIWPIIWKKKNDTLKLLDLQGKTVSTYNY